MSIYIRNGIIYLLFIYYLFIRPFCLFIIIIIIITIIIIIIIISSS